MTTRDKIEVMEAYERGEQIQFVAGNVGIWNDFSRDYLHEPTWDWQHLTYRIKPKEPVKPKLNRWPIVEKNGNLYVENLEMLPLDRMCSRREFRTGHFELNDGTKSKIPYLWKDKKTGAPHSCLAESNNADYYESLYPVAVWLEE